jgi:hypothetical protein
VKALSADALRNAYAAAATGERVVSLPL